MTPTPFVFALFRLSSAAMDEQSMLQMPAVGRNVATETSECWCPGYFEEACRANEDKGCVWHPHDGSNAPWCGCDEEVWGALTPPIFTGGNPPVDAHAQAADPPATYAASPMVFSAPPTAFTSGAAVPQVSYNLMAYGWFPDFTQPNFLNQRMALFDYQDGDLSATNEPSGFVRFINEESFEATSTMISTEMGLEGNYGPAFSASIATSLTSGSRYSHRQMVAIYRSRVVKSKVMNNVLFPHERLRPEVLSYIQDPQTTAEDIITTLGEFYATQMSLGGVIRMKCQQTRTVTDTYSAFAAQVEAEVGNLFASVNLHAGVATSDSATGSAESLHIQVDWQGGDGSIMLRGGDFEDNKRDWSDTLNDNLFPLTMRLRPLWEVIKRVDQAKGDLVEQSLRSRWEDGRMALLDVDGLSSKGSYGCANLAGTWRRRGDGNIYTLELSGQQLTLTHADGRVETMERDSSGRLQCVHNCGGTATPSTDCRELQWSNGATATWERPCEFAGEWRRLSDGAKYVLVPEADGVRHQCTQYNRPVSQWVTWTAIASADELECEGGSCSGKATLNNACSQLQWSDGATATWIREHPACSFAGTWIRAGDDNVYTIVQEDPAYPLYYMTSNGHQEVYVESSEGIMECHEGCNGKARMQRQCTQMQWEDGATATWNRVSF